MSTETLQTNDEESVFPGENWFFYWKTSASLWRSKLGELTNSNKIIVPINWSFHSEMGERFDFGELKPETNLSQLSTIASELGKEVIYFIPISPAPFIQNGGLPHFLSKALALDYSGMGMSQVGSNEELFKIFSWFDPKVFKAFNRFISAMGQYFYQSGINNDVYGMVCGFLHEGRFHSFLEDTSKEFHEAFSRYLDAKLKDQSTDFEKPQNEIEEMVLMHEFENLIGDLYRTSVEEGLSANFDGIVKVNFLGSSTTDTLKRIMRNEEVSRYSQELFESISRKMFVSTALLPKYLKKGVFGYQLKELVSENYITQMLDKTIEEDGFLTYAPLGYFEVFENSFLASFREDSWRGLGLLDFLYDRYRFSFFQTEDKDFNFSEENVNDSKVYFFQGEELTQHSYSEMLKFFMSGGQIILNRTGMPQELGQRLEMFLIENRLKVEKVNYSTEISNVQLNSGRMVLFHGENLVEQSDKSLQDFWSKLISTFNILHLEISVPDDVQVAWQSRNISTAELNFEEIRRVSFYNGSSYKKKVKVPHVKNFALVKIQDEKNVTVSNWSQETEIELLPDGHISMDFGVYSS